MALNTEAVRWLSLPSDEYAIIGSGILEAHGIRLADDTEIVVTDELYDLIASHPQVWVRTRWNGHKLLMVSTPYGQVEVNREASLTPGIFPGTELTLASVEIHQGLPFAGLVFTRDWKEALGRLKDVLDVAAIDDYLKQQA